MQEFLDVAIHTRAKRHSPTAGVAYRVGANLTEVTTGEEHRFGHRERDVIQHGIEGGSFESPQSWANAIEVAETRRNSQFYRDVRLALPCELSQKRQLDLARQWSDYLAERYETSVLYAVHRPAGKSDQRNVHAHCVLPTRTLSGPASFKKGVKIRSIDPDSLSGWWVAWNSMQREELAVALAAGELAEEHQASVALDLLCHLDHANEEMATRYRRAALEATPRQFRQALRRAWPGADTVASDNGRRRQLHGQLTLCQLHLEGLQSRYAGLQRQIKVEGLSEEHGEALKSLKSKTATCKKLRKGIRGELAKDTHSRRYTAAFCQATAAGHPDPEEAAHEAMSRPRVHLGAADVAAERAKATAKDRAAAKAAGRAYRPVRRSVSDLLAYTQGVSERGQSWIKELLQNRYANAKAAWEEGIQALRELTGRPRKSVVGPTRLQPAAAPAGGPGAPPPDLEG